MARSKSIFLLITLAFLSALVSCSSNSKEKKAQEKPAADLKVGMMPVLDCLPFYVADYSHLFRHDGLKVKIVTYNSALKCAAAVERGEIDGAYLTIPELIYLHSQGVSLKAVMKTDGKMTVVTGKAKRIKKLSNMKERTIAISRNNTSDYLLDEIADITKIKTFELLRPQINDVFVRVQMLADNQIDAAVLPDPYADIAIANGNVKVYSTTNSKINFGCVCFADSVLEKKGDKVRNFLDSYSKVLPEIAKNRNSADSVLLKIYRIPLAQVDSVEIPTFPRPAAVSDKDFELAAKWCQRRGVTKEIAKAGDLVSNKYIPKK